MFPSFLPSQVNQLKDAEAIAFVENSAIQCAMLHQEMPGWHDAMISYVKTGGYSDLANKIAQVDKPTLILWGEDDNMLSPGDGEKFQRNITNSRLIKLKNCGHAPQIEQPQITSQEILQFLTQHG